MKELKLTKVMRMFPAVTVLALLAGPAASGLFAQLMLVKTTSNPTPTAGGAAFAYTLDVTNTSGGPLTFVKVTDPLPAGVFLANGNIGVTGAPFSCSGPPIGTNGAVICETSFLATAGTAIITIVAQIVPGVAGGIRTNTARVVSGSGSATGSVALTILNNVRCP